MIDNFNNWNILLQQYKKEYPELSIYNDNMIFKICESIQETDIFINEFLSSLKISTIERVLETLYDTINYKLIKINDHVFNILINLNSVEDEYNILELINKLNTLGWFCSTINSSKFSKDTLKNKIIGLIKNRAPEIILRFESYHSTELNFKEKNIDYIYHLTTKDVIDKIRTYGLSPKNGIKNTYHPKRIYFFTSTNYINIASTELFKIENTINRKKDEKYLITIKVNDLKDNIKFYNDPEFSNSFEAIYTYYNIPPNILHISKI